MHIYTLYIEQNSNVALPKTLSDYTHLGFSKHQTFDVIHVEIIYLHCTRNWTRLLMEGGTPFDATHKYAAMCRRLTFVISSISPSTTFTVRNTQNYLRHLCIYCIICRFRKPGLGHQRVDRQTKLSSSTTPCPTQLHGMAMCWGNYCGIALLVDVCFVRCYKLEWLMCRIVTVFTSNGHFVAVLPSPHHIGLRISFCLTH